MLMMSEGEMCVCELMCAMDISQPMISRHLALLREDSIVVGRREGQWVYYSINPELEKWISTILSITYETTKHETWFVKDIERLKNMANRPGSTCCA